MDLFSASLARRGPAGAERAVAAALRRLLRLHGAQSWTVVTLFAAAGPANVGGNPQGDPARGAARRLRDDRARGPAPPARLLTGKFAEALPDPAAWPG